MFIMSLQVYAFGGASLLSAASLCWNTLLMNSASASRAACWRLPRTILRFEAPLFLNLRMFSLFRFALLALALNLFDMLRAAVVLMPHTQ